MTIVSAYLGSIILCIPSFVTFGIEQQEIGDPLDPSAANLIIYKVNLNPIAKHHDDLVHKVSLVVGRHVFHPSDVPILFELADVHRWRQSHHFRVFLI